jgi:hypothetical protein
VSDYLGALLPCCCWQHAMTLLAVASCLHALLQTCHCLLLLFSSQQLAGHCVRLATACQHPHAVC